MGDDDFITVTSLTRGENVSFEMDTVIYFKMNTSLSRSVTVNVHNNTKVSIQSRFCFFMPQYQN